MTTLASVCLVLITLALWIGLIILIVAGLQLRRTAQAVEARVYEIGDHLHGLRRAASAASQLSSLMRSRWIRGLGLALGAATTFYSTRSRWRKAREEDPPPGGQNGGS